MEGGDFDGSQKEVLEIAASQENIPFLGRISIRKHSFSLEWSSVKSWHLPILCMKLMKELPNICQVLHV